jgi:hypothetical protein
MSCSTADECGLFVAAIVESDDDGERVFNKRRAVVFVTFHTPVKTNVTFHTACGNYENYA